MKIDPVYVFLTRGEIHIHGEVSLSTHLRPKDNRLKLISKNIGKNLNFVVINPILTGSFKGFFTENWYLIPNVRYSGSSDHSGYVHFSFTYRFDQRSQYTLKYGWQKGEAVRNLTSKEIKKFRKEQTL